MSLVFEWSEDKARANLRKHKVSFDEAQTVFLADLSRTVPDAGHSQSEPRFRIVGLSSMKKLLVDTLNQRAESNAFRSQIL